MVSEPYSVSRYLDRLNGFLEKAAATVVGEVSQVDDRGHVYFTIKDSEANAVLQCIMWKSRYVYTGVQLEVGMAVQLRGKPNIYAPYGKLSFIAESLELVGEGALKIAYDKLKAKLTAEGIFEEAKKRPIPDFIKTIGVVTSARGAVIHDFMNNLGKNNFQVSMMHTMVEGPESGKELILSMRAFKREHVDVVVLIRGGGSMQSLAGFDNELLVREIATYPVPVLAGIGHHEDIPLAALAADVTASTPSIVATMINDSWNRARQSVATYEQSILHEYQYALRDARELLHVTHHNATHKLSRFLKEYEVVQNTLEQTFLVWQEKLKHIGETLDSALRPMTQMVSVSIARQKEYLRRMPQLANQFERVTSQYRSVQQEELSTLLQEFARSQQVTQQTLAELEANVRHNNPERQLALGYSIVTNKNRVVRSVTDVTPDDTLEIRVGDGSIKSNVI